MIVTCYYQYLYASSPLLLRNPPNAFAFIPLQAMSLSSINRSNFNTFCHIMPYSAPVCEGMHYHKTEVPWQTNNILIFSIFPLFSGFSSLFTFLYQQPYVKNEKPAIAFNESILGYPLPVLPV